MKMSPREKPLHQRVISEIVFQIQFHLRGKPIGAVLCDTDVWLGTDSAGRDLIYKPEVIFVRAERLSKMQDKITGPPDVVVEVISRGSRRYASETKKNDYERFGVREYWLIDPRRDAITFYLLKEGRYVEVEPGGNTLRSEVIPGFALDVPRLRATFEGW